MTTDAMMGLEHFRQLYRCDGDPWKVRTSWYEQRKRDLVLACLPHQHYQHCYEPGCGNGELTALLALRCTNLLASDGADTAVALAKKHVQQSGVGQHVRIEQHRLPEDWPRQEKAKFDLILVSEVAYYLEPCAYAQFAANALESLAPDGTLLLCHWRPSFADRALTTQDAHDCFHAAESLQLLLHHEEANFLIDVWAKSSELLPRQGG